MKFRITLLSLILLSGVTYGADESKTPDDKISVKEILDSHDTKLVSEIKAALLEAPLEYSARHQILKEAANMLRHEVNPHMVLDIFNKLREKKHTNEKEYKRDYAKLRLNLIRNEAWKAVFQFDKLELDILLEKEV